MLVSCFTLNRVRSFIRSECEAGTIRSRDVPICEQYAMASVSDMYGIVCDGWATSCEELERYYAGYADIFKTIRMLTRMDVKHCPLDPRRKLNWFPDLMAEVA